MASIDTPIPTFTVHESAKSYVDDVNFDDVRYAEYLHERGVDDQRIDNLHLTITTKGFGPAVAANYGRVDDVPTIRFSAQHISNSIKKQNNVLFHETEHFIWEAKHPRMFQAKAALLFSSMGASALGMGAMLGDAAYGATEALPLPVQLVATGISGITAGALGGFSGLFVSSASYQGLSPNEINARIAARRETKRHEAMLQVSLK